VGDARSTAADRSDRERQKFVVGLPAAPGLAQELAGKLAGPLRTRLQRLSGIRAARRVPHRPDWEQKAKGCVAQLRAVAGTDPDAPDLAALGELIVKRPDFNRLWERYEVRAIGDGSKTFLHPAVGTMTLTHEVMTLNRTDGQRIVIYMAPADTPDHDAMTLLDLTAPDVMSEVGERTGSVGPR
jgi:hypothetical protein